ncbi:hypothetical protein E2C01_043000 [Portunus trituberculatus]|uniref:Uncharacterized protein n=1 Tax=Portunus trituberculatus TaxID=210409 RepID=A0A5B7FY18_PORTR|nr:hypothetical protein [Portunus trituberculatus]
MGGVRGAKHTCDAVSRLLRQPVMKELQPRGAWKTEAQQVLGYGKVGGEGGMGGKGEGHYHLDTRGRNVGDKV